MKKNTNADNGNKQKPQPEKKTLQQFFADNLTPFIHGLSTKAKICALYFFFTPIWGENYPEKGRQIMIAEILLKSAGSVTVKKQVPARGRCRHLFGVFRRSVYA